MSEPIKLGVIGAGWFASRRHLPDAVASPDVTVQALCRRDRESLRVMAEHFGVAQTFTDYRDMLDSADLDAVLIATPHALHYEHAKAALERGLHVLLEKPMTVRSDHARELVALAEGKGLVLIVSLNPPYWKHIQFLRDLIREGKLGEVEGIDSQWTGNAEGLFARAPLPDQLPGVVRPTLYRADPELNGGGYFIDGGSHQVSEVLWTTRLAATEVAALMDELPSDARALVSVRLENGALATIAGVNNSRLPGKRVRLTVFGSEGTAAVEGLPFRVTFTPRGGEPTTIAEDELPDLPTPVQNLADAIRGRAEPRSAGQEGLAVVEVVEAAYRSASEGKAVKLSPGPWTCKRQPRRD